MSPKFPVLAGLTVHEAVDQMKFSRRGLFALGAGGAAMFLAPKSFAQDGTPKRGGTLTIGADADPIGLDPITVTAFSSYDFLSLIYAGLLRWSPTMEIETDIAESYEVVDDTTYRFKIRQGVTFHNGQKLDAHDVKFTFDRSMNPETGSRLLRTYASIDSVTVLDDYTVEFKLKGPDAAFLRFLATIPDGAILPRDVTGHETAPIGAGPFKFESYEPNQQLSLVRFDGFYEEGLPYLDKVVFRFFKDQSALTSALRSKAIDMTWLKNPMVADMVTKATPDIVSAPGQTSRVFPVYFNLKEGPLTDVRVRRAISLATDRAEALATVLGGSGKVGAIIPESQIGGYDGESELPYYTPNIDEAKKLLAEAGYADGIDLGEFIVVAANDLDVACAQILQQQWAKAGIKVAIKPMETAPLLEMANKGTYPTLLSVALSWSPDPDAILSRVMSTSDYGAAQGYTDTNLDEMVRKARATVNEDERAKLNREITAYMADQAYMLHIYQYPLRWEMWWNYVKGYHALAANIRTYVRTTWLDK